MSMSQESGSKECSLLDTLRNFKPIQKPKLSHMPLSTNYDSSSGNIIFNSFSELMYS